MAEILTLYNQSGEKTGQISVKKEFLPEKINPTLLHQVTVAYQANQRQGNASTKKRGEVRGGGIKPWRQKGTGRARVGSRRSPIWVGGGIVFGPQPRSYYVRVPKKIKGKAMAMAVKKKIEMESLLVLDEFKLQEPKTKLVRPLLKTLGVEEKKILFLIHEADENIRRATRNIKHFSLKEIRDCNALDILLADKVIITKEALEKMQNS